MDLKLLFLGFLLLTQWQSSAVGATFNRTLDLAPTAQRATPVPAALFGANIGYWSEVNGPALVASAQEAGLTVLRYHPGTYNDPHTVGGAINQWDFTAVDSFGAQRLGDFGRFLIASGTTGQIHINYAAGSPEQAAALVAYLRVPTDAPAALLNRALGSAVLEPSIIAPYTRTRDWRTVGFWANLRASAPLAVDDGFNKLRLSHPAPFPVKYWECGNEADYTFVPCLRYRLPGENSITQGATGFGGRRADARTYANFYAVAKSLMQQIDPTIEVGASAGYFEQAGNDTDSAAVPFLFPGPSGTTKAWTPVMLTRLRELGITPDFIIAHRYTQDTNFAWNNDYLLRGALQAYLAPGQGALPRIHVTELNWSDNEFIPNTTTINNAVNLARSFGDALQSDVNNISWFTFTSGSANYNPSSSTGWRRYHNWGLIADDPLASQNPNASALTWPGMFAGARFPTFHAFALLKQFARPGDSIYQVSALSPANTNSAEVTVFAARRLSGSYTLLVLNKADATHTLNLTLQNADLSAFSPTFAGLRYGKAQDEEQRLKAIATPAIKTNNTREAFTVSRTGSALSYSVPPLSVTVLELPTLPTAAPAFSSAPGVVGVRGQAIVHQLSATGGSVTFAVTGQLPAGLTFSPDTARITGTPTQAGDFSIALTATNSVGTAQQVFHLSVRERVLVSIYAEDFSGPGSDTRGWWSYQGDAGVSGALARGPFGPAGAQALQHNLTVNPATATYWYAGTGTNLAMPAGLTIANRSEYSVRLRLWSQRSSSSEFDITLKTAQTQNLTHRVTIPGQTWTDVAFALDAATNSSFNFAASQIEFIVVPNSASWTLASTAYAVTDVLIERSDAQDTALQSWRRIHFGSILPLGTAAEAADPDGDGMANLLEYALGRSPIFSADAVTTMPIARLMNDRLNLTFTPVVLTDITYVVESSSDLVLWTPSNIASTDLTVAQAYTHIDSVDVSDDGTPRRFLRLRVARP